MNEAATEDAWAEHSVNLPEISAARITIVAYAYQISRLLVIQHHLAYNHVELRC
jgi:hypothetical protein